MLGDEQDIAWQCCLFLPRDLVAGASAGLVQNLIDSQAFEAIRELSINLEFSRDTKFEILRLYIGRFILQISPK